MEAIQKGFMDEMMKVGISGLAKKMMAFKPKMPKAPKMPKPPKVTPAKALTTPTAQKPGMVSQGIKP